MRLGNREIPTASVRKSKIPEFKRRTLVHFTECVTTRLADDVTYFQPFDKGCEGGAGNPHDPAGHSYRTRTAYLWEEVFAWDSLLISTLQFSPAHKKVAELLRLFYTPSNFDSSPGETRRR